MDCKKVRKKLLAVGGIGSGTTELLYIFSEDVKYEPETCLYIPAVFEPFVKEMRVDDQEFELDLYDFSPNSVKKKFRPLQYPNTDIVLMCFSTKIRESFKEVEDEWIPEVKQFCPDVLIVLVGNHTKRIEDDFYHVDPSKIETKVSTKEGRELAKKIRAICYMECCAKKKEGLIEIFDTAARAALHGRPKKKRCIIQ